MLHLNFLLLQLILFSGISVNCDKGCSSVSTCLPVQQCNSSAIAGFAFSCGENEWCCPTNAIISPVVNTRFSDIDRPSPPKRQRLSANNPHRNMNLLPHTDCGMSIIDKRINSGLTAKLGQFPWMVLLAFRMNVSSSETVFLCGGTLISKRYVLTAAHCLRIPGVGLPVSVRLGEHHLSTEEDCEVDGDEELCADLHVDIPVEEVIIHPRYNKVTFKNDIALIRLNRNVNQTSFISPICLPFHINITGEELKKYTVAGWGKLDHDENEGSDSLQFANIWSSPLTQCNGVQSKQVKPLDHTQLCAGGAGGMDACKGDSGGPLLDTLGDRNGVARAYQLGIVSFGTIPCGTEYKPSVYTRVSAYLTWILNKLKP